MTRIFAFFALTFSILQSFSQSVLEKEELNEVFEKYGKKGCFVIFDQKLNLIITSDKEVYDKRLSPGETFFPLAALSGLDEGIIKTIDQIFPKVQCPDGQICDLTNSLLNSYAPYFEYVLKKLKKKRISRMLENEHYGSIYPDGNISTFWKEEELVISPKEQVLMWAKLHSGESFFSKKSVDLVFGALEKKDSLDNFYAEFTGQLEFDTVSYSWHIGSYSKVNHHYFYATLMDGRLKSDPDTINYTEITWDIFRELDILPKPIIPIPPTPEPTLDEMMGQMVLVGVEGTKIDTADLTIKAIREKKVGGIILYEKNISDTASFSELKALIDTLQSVATIPLFISIDQEGGAVNRLRSKYGFPESVSAQFLGTIDNLDTTFYYGTRIGQTLDSLGINLNYAPVVDLGVTDNFIKKKKRCYSDDPEKVALHAASFIKGHHEYNVATVLKHFPGHGSANGDSHMGMVDVTTTWKRNELIPYRNIIDSGLCDAIMTAHILNYQMNTDSLPATLSYEIITGLLRDSLHFDGVIFSDDMQMGAIAKFYGLENAVNLCINAGVDILMYSHNIIGSHDHAADRIFGVIKTLVENGDISEERIRQSYDRITALKTKYQIINE